MTATPSQPFNCDEKGALLIAYAQATRVYSQAVADLTRVVGAIAHSDFEVLKRKVAAAREQSEEARQRLEEHVRKHFC